MIKIFIWIITEAVFPQNLMAFNDNNVDNK